MLRVHVLGELEVDVDGAPLAPPAGRRARALLAYLALHPGLHPRATLASRFWPDVLDESARTSLRGALADVRRAVGDALERGAARGVDRCRGVRRTGGAGARRGGARAVPRRAAGRPGGRLDRRR